MDSLSNEQAQQLFEAGGFIVIADLPEGTEVGIDGTYHVTRRFSGFKFVPPGLHLLTWSSGSAGPAAIPIRSALIRVHEPRERVVLKYDASTENVLDVGETISDDRLKALDGELAAYPFDGLPRWRQLTEHISPELLRGVVGDDGRVDGMMSAEGEEETARGKALQFPAFNLKRSWRDGAIGEEVTRFSKDKSWLLGHIAETQCNSDPFVLLGHLQLSFIVILHLSSYSALLVYKRLLPLFTRSADVLVSPATYVPDLEVCTFFAAFIRALASQLDALPEGCFETELPELDLFYMDEIESLRTNICASLPTWEEPGDVKVAWAELGRVTDKWQWEAGTLAPQIRQDEAQSGDDEDEEGEYAPVIVEL